MTNFTKPSTFVSGFHDETATQQMSYQRLGNTDMIVSKMTFGGSAVGSVFRKTDDAESKLVVETALKQGINMIDTAPWYGHGKSETVLGKVLSGIPRSAYYLNTKVGRYDPEPEKMFDFRAERVIQSVDESLQRLGAEYLDVVQIHDMEFAPNLDIIINETLPALQKVKESGKARYIGITGYPMENFKTVIEKSQVKIDTILTYCHGSLNDSTLLGYLPYLQEKSVGIINASILSMGLLTERGPSSWHPASDEIRQTCKDAVEYCKKQDVEIAKIATHYSLQLPGVHTTLIGTASLKNLDTNLRVLKEGVTTKEQRVSEEIVEKYFKPLKCATWEGVEVGEYRKNLQKSV